MKKLFSREVRNQVYSRQSRKSFKYRFIKGTAQKENFFENLQYLLCCLETFFQVFFEGCNFEVGTVVDGLLP